MKKQIFFVFVVFLFIIQFNQAIASQINLGGFAWIGDNLVKNGEVGDAAVGMLAFSGSSLYQTFLEEEFNGERLVRGKAWLGIGNQNDIVGNFTNQNDHPSLGYLVFDQGVPSSDCYGQGNCYPLRWNRKSGSTGSEGFFSGWAIFNLGKDGSGFDYPDTWAHFKTPPDINNYNCDDSISRNNNYYSCTDEVGNIHGYAWSSGIASNTITNNPGFGWISLSRAAFNSNTSPESCSVIQIGQSQQNSVDCPETFDVNYEVQCGEGNLNLTGFSYRWKCQGDTYDPISSDRLHTCHFTSEGDYRPEAKVFDRNGNEITTYPAPIFRLINIPKCSIEVKKINDIDINYADNLDNVFLNEEVSANVVYQCLRIGELTWTPPYNLSMVSSSLPVTLKIFATGTGKLKASIRKEGTSTWIECSEATIITKERFRWGE